VYVSEFIPRTNVRVFFAMVPRFLAFA
jgi:hypothetical protein